MAISLTTDGLNLDYRTTKQNTVSGTYPIGTVIATSKLLTLPGTWVQFSMKAGDSDCVSEVSGNYLAIRVE